MNSQRDQLLQRIERANARAWPALIVTTVLGALCAYAIDWPRIMQNPLPALIVIGAVAGGYLTGLLILAGQKKTRLSELKESARFGEYDKHRLHALVRETEAALALPRDATPVYLTRDKTLNAGAINVGLLFGFQRLNGIYLHRQVLHVVRPAELKFIIGHELGHFYRHFLVWDRWRLLVLLTGALAGLFLLQAGFEHAAAWQWGPYVGVIGVGLLSGLFVMAISFPTMKYAQTIEHLCDDFGAQAAGVTTAINALLKMGAESEAMSRALRMILEYGSRKQEARPDELYQLFEEALPFGALDRAEVDRTLEQSIRKHAEQQSKFSWGGLWDHVWASDEEVDEEAMQEQLDKHRKLDDCELIDWRALAPPTSAGELANGQIEQLVALIEANPKALLFRVPEELPGAATTHPSTRSRILYLWKNRAEITAAAALPTAR